MLCFNGGMDCVEGKRRFHQETILNSLLPVSEKFGDSFFYIRGVLCMQMNMNSFYIREIKSGVLSLYLFSL